MYLLAVLLCFAAGAAVYARLTPVPPEHRLTLTQPRPLVPDRPEVVIAAIGDIMVPLSLQKAVIRGGRGYDCLFEKIAPDLASADLVFANLETPVDDQSPISGYPRFNTRTEFLATLKKAHIGIVSVANNHALDAGPWGLVRTMDTIEKQGLLLVGAGRTASEAEQATWTTVRGIRTAFLAFTYDTNQGMPRRKKNLPVVNILRANSEPDLQKAVARVREVRTSADLVIVSLHWGEEYRTEPTAWQRRVAAQLIAAGADAILGHHPHVLQPIESITAQNERQGIVAFSLGNFLSTQNYGVTGGNSSNPRALRGDGVILSLVAVKKNGMTSISRAEFLPIWTLRETVGNITVPRPVNLSREIARIESDTRRKGEGEGVLRLLKYRRDIITGKFWQGRGGGISGHAANAFTAVR